MNSTLIGVILAFVLVLPISYISYKFILENYDGDNFIVRMSPALAILADLAFIPPLFSSELGIGWCIAFLIFGGVALFIIWVISKLRIENAYVMLFIFIILLMLIGGATLFIWVSLK